MYLSAANAVILPYREVLNSGSALLALSCSRPVMVPDRGAMSELRADFSSDWVNIFQGPLDVPVLQDALRWGVSRGLRFVPCPRPTAGKISGGNCPVLSARDRSQSPVPSPAKVVSVGKHE